jgi:hypothetical protein
MTRARVANASSIGRIAVVIGLLAHVVMFVWVVLGRITFPFELEWMTGSMADHVERVRAGLPLYTEPSSSWIPFLYPPLYYWVCALAGGSALACRLVSVVASLAQVALARRIARDLGASRFWAWAAAGMTLACFSYVGWWYDLERSDSLYGALMVMAAAVAVRARGAPSYALAGALIGVGFLAKQQSAFYGAGLGAGLVLATRWTQDRVRARDVIAFGGAAATSLVLLVAYAIRRESDWFVYYVLKMPRAHGVMLSLASSTLVRDLLLGFALVAATVLAGLFAARRLRAGQATRAEVLFVSMLLAGFAGAVLSRLHIGGWINVLQPWTAFAAIAAAVLASRHEEARAGSPRPVAIVLGLTAVQLAAWGYDPGRYCPKRSAPERHGSFAALVRRLEDKGEVIVPARGHISRARHFHISALADAVRVDGRSPPDLVEKLRTRAFAAVIDDARGDEQTADEDWPPVLLEDIADLREPLLAGYFVSERLDDDQVSLPLPGPALPVWVYLPRKAPLVGASREALRRRQLAEMRLAVAKANARLKGIKLGFEAADIEEMAAREAR